MNTTQRSDLNLTSKICTYPVTHGVRLFMFFSSTEVYRAFIRKWRELKLSYGRTHDFLIGEDEVLIFSSKKFKAYRDKSGEENKRFFEYLLTKGLQTDKGIVKPPKSLNIIVQPQYLDMFYRDGNPVSVPQEGTLLDVSTAFMELEEIEQKVFSTLRYILGKTYFHFYEQDKTRIAKLERYIRYDEQKESKVVWEIDKTHELIGWCSKADYHVKVDRCSGGWKMYRLDSQRWDIISHGAITYPLTVKSYRSDNMERVDPLRHPKLEVSLWSKLMRPKPQRDEWYHIRNQIDELLGNFCSWCNLTQDDLIEDSFFRSSGELTYHLWKGRGEDLRALYENMNGFLGKQFQRNTILQFFKIITQNGGYCSYNELKDGLGISKRQIREIIKEFEDKEIVVRYRSGAGFVELKYPFLKYKVDKAIREAEAMDEEIEEEVKEKWKTLTAKLKPEEFKELEQKREKIGAKSWREFILKEVL